MSSEQEIKATVTIKGEVSMGYDPGLVMHYYVPNADIDGTRKRLLKAEFREIDEPTAQFLQEIKATVSIDREVSMGIDTGIGVAAPSIPIVKVDPMRYYVPKADMDETKERLLKAEFRLHPRSAVAALNDEAMPGSCAGDHAEVPDRRPGL